MALLAFGWRAGAGSVPLPLLVGVGGALLVQGLALLLARAGRLPAWHVLAINALLLTLASLAAWLFPQHQLTILILALLPFVETARWRASDALFLLLFFPLPFLFVLSFSGTIERVYLPPLVTWLVVVLLSISMARPASHNDLLRSFLAPRLFWLVSLLAVSWDPVAGQIPTLLLFLGSIGLAVEALLFPLALSGRLPSWHAPLSALGAVLLNALALWLFPERQAVLLLLGLIPILDLARWHGAGALFLLTLFPIPVLVPLNLLGEVPGFDVLALAAFLLVSVSNSLLARARPVEVEPTPVEEPKPEEAAPEIFRATIEQMASPASSYDDILQALVRGGSETLNSGSLQAQARALALSFLPDDLNVMGVTALFNLEPSLAKRVFKVRGVLGTLLVGGEPLDASSDQPPFDDIRTLWNYRLILLPLRHEQELFGAVIFASRDESRVQNIEVQRALIEMARQASLALHRVTQPGMAAALEEDAYGWDEAEAAEADGFPPLATTLEQWGAAAPLGPLRPLARGLRAAGRTVLAYAREARAVVQEATERPEGRTVADIGPWPLLFAALALLAGVTVGLFPLALSDRSMFLVVGASSLPVLFVMGMGVYRFWKSSASLPALAGGGMAGLPGQAHFPVMPDRVKMAGRRIAMPLVSAPRTEPMGWLEWGLLLLVFTTYTRFSDVLVHNHGLPSTAQPLVLLLLLGIVASALFQKRAIRGWQRPALLLLAYGLVRGGSLLYAADFAPALEALIDYTKDSIIALVVVCLLQRGETLRRVTWSLLWAGIFLGTVSTIQYFTGSFHLEFWGFGQANVMHIVGVTEDFRLGGPLGEPNSYAQFMVPLVPLALERVWHERRLILRLVALWSFLVVLLAIVFTFSRGALVSLGAMGGLALLLHPPRPRDIMMGLLVLAILFPFVPSEYTQRMATLLEVIPGFSDGPSQEVSFRGRTSEVTVGWMMFTDHPLLGVGLHNYPTHYQDYSRRLGLDPRREARAPHSLYLEIMSELGLLGIGTFGALLWAMFYGVRLARARLVNAGRADYADLVTAIGMGLVGYLVGGLFLHAAYPRFFWLFVGIALAAPQAAQFEDWRSLSPRRYARRPTVRPPLEVARGRS